MEPLARRIEAPFDSGDYPKGILLNQDEVDSSYCDTCGAPAEEWADNYPSVGGRPCAIFAAALYCATCQPYSYEENNGLLMHTLSGEYVAEDEAIG